MFSGMMGVKKGTIGKRGDCMGESSERGETLWVEITNEKRTCKARMFPGEGTTIPRFMKYQHLRMPTEVKEQASVVRIWREANGDKYETRSGNQRPHHARPHRLWQKAWNDPQ